MSVKPSTRREALPPSEEQRLRDATKNGTESIRRRALAMVAWNEGVPATEAAKRAKLTENQVRYLWRMYKLKGIDLYLVDDEPVSKTPVPATPEPTAVVEEPGITLTALCAEYNIDMAHAKHVAHLALDIFDRTANLHRLPESDRTLLETAAILHNIAVHIDEAKHHTRGRDIILSTPIQGFTEEERQMLALTTAFHRKKVKPESDPIYKAFSESIQREVLALSAILRVADGLDYSGTQSTIITDIDAHTGEVILTLTGEHSESDGVQAIKKADLWQAVFAVTVRIDKPVDPTMRENVLPEIAPTLDSKMTVAHAGRLFMAGILTRIDAILKAAQGGDLTALTVLARESTRLESAAMVADAPDFRREISWLIESADQALIRAILLERLESLGVQIPPESPHVAELEAALQALDQRRYLKLSTGLRDILNDVDPDEKAIAAHQIGSILWGHLTNLRSVMEFGTSVADALNATRRLQDHLTAFSGLLGGEVAQVLDMLTPLENYLNAISLAQGIVTMLEPKPVKQGRKTVTPERDESSTELRRVQIELVNMLADGLPGAWVAVNSPLFRRAFALAIATA